MQEKQTNADLSASEALAAQIQKMHSARSTFGETSFSLREMFKEWNSTTYADDHKTRLHYQFSVELMANLLDVLPDDPVELELLINNLNTTSHAA